MLLSGTRSIRNKLLLVVLATAFAALVVTGAAMAIYDIRTYERTWVIDLAIQAEILGRASAPALAFDDPKSAREYLSLLKARPNISAAAIYNSKGKLFASYVHSDASTTAFPTLPELDGSRIEGAELVQFKRIVENNEILGTVYLRARYELPERLKDYLGILGGVMVLSMLVALLMSAWLQAAVTKPILAVTEVARQVMERRDFTLRARKTTEDEVGYLVEAFNDMLAEVGRRAEALEASNRSLALEMAERKQADQDLRQLNVELERRVTERTGQLSESREQFRAVTETANDAIVSADNNGNIIYFNQAASEIFGHTVDEAIGQPLTLLMPASFHAAHRAGLKRFLSGQPPTVVGKTVELAGRRKDGTEFPLDLSLASWRTSAGVFFTGIIRDITERKEVEGTLKRTNEELSVANKELESFSYSVAHDLRSPLRAIDGFSRIVQEDYAEKLDDEGRRQLGVIRDNSQRMGQLINDLLEFSRLGRKSLSIGEIDMKRMVDDVLKEVPMAGERRPRLMLAGLPPAHGDPPMVKQAWANLLTNAIKFSSRREQPQIEVSGYSDGAYNIYCVRDNGAGFDMQYYDKLFGVFQRLHSTEEFPGTGVGLAIVQRVIARHGGRVWAEGKPEEGAAFYFSLPKGKQHGQI